MLLTSSLATAQVVVPAPPTHILRGVRVTVAPPPLRYESPQPAPSGRHQWIPGFWAWRGGAHVWIGGHWALPPAPTYVWEPDRWEHRRDGHWEAHRGHWDHRDHDDWDRGDRDGDRGHDRH